jgi:hypothetical protein
MKISLFAIAVIAKKKLKIRELRKFLKKTSPFKTYFQTFES